MKKVEIEKKLEELAEQLHEKIESVLDYLDSEDLLRLGNAYRDNHYGNELHELTDYELDSELNGYDPSQIIDFVLENRYFSKDDEYFSFDGYELQSTDDPLEDTDFDEIADMIIEEMDDYDIDDISDILREYEEAKEELEEELNNLNENQEAAREVLEKFTNCEADWRDLYAMLEKLVRDDDVWADKKGED